MNYIQRLQAENKDQAEEIERLKEGLHSLLRYVQSSKFDGPNPEDGLVNTADIVLRIREIQMGGK